MIEQTRPVLGKVFKFNQPWSRQAAQLIIIEQNLYTTKGYIVQEWNQETLMAVKIEGAISIT